MKKAAAFFLAAALALTACACAAAGDANGARSRYDRALQALSDAETLETGLSVEIRLTQSAESSAPAGTSASAADPQSMTIEMQCDAKADLRDANKPKLQGTGSCTLPFAGTTGIELCYLDGVMYLASGNEKMKAELDRETAGSFFRDYAFPEPVTAKELLEITAEEVEGATVLRYTCKNSLDNRFFRSIFENALGEADKDAVTIDAFSGEVTLGADGAPTVLTTRVETTIRQDGVAIHAQMTVREEIRSRNASLNIQAPADSDAYELVSADTLRGIDA